MNASQNINQDSGNVEWWTKTFIIEAARVTMGSIDLDPASCTKANETVQARQYFTVEDDGLKQCWLGNVWMNHPYSDGEEVCKPNCKKKKCKGKRGYCITKRIPANSEWINKLVSEYEAGHVKQACLICYASTSEKWFQPLYSYPICFRNKRDKFTPGIGQQESGSTKGCVIVYLGPHVERFAYYFGSLGSIMVPY